MSAAPLSGGPTSTPPSAHLPGRLCTLSGRPSQGKQGGRQVVVEDEFADQPRPDGFERNLRLRRSDGQYDHAGPRVVARRRGGAGPDVFEPNARPPLVDAADDSVTGVPRQEDAADVADRPLLELLFRYPLRDHAVVEQPAANAGGHRADAR